MEELVSVAQETPSKYAHTWVCWHHFVDSVDYTQLMACPPWSAPITFSVNPGLPLSKGHKGMVTSCYPPSSFSPLFFSLLSSLLALFPIFPSLLSPYIVYRWATNACLLYGLTGSQFLYCKLGAWFPSTTVRLNQHSPFTLQWICLCFDLSFFNLTSLFFALNYQCIRIKISNCWLR